MVPSFPHSRAPWGSAASDPSPSLSACLKTASWMGATIILCTGGWAILLRHPTCSSSPRQLNCPLLFPYTLGSLLLISPCALTWFLQLLWGHGDRSCSSSPSLREGSCSTYRAQLRLAHLTPRRELMQLIAWQKSILLLLD